MKVREGEAERKLQKVCVQGITKNKTKNKQKNGVQLGKMQEYRPNSAMVVVIVE